MMHRLKYFLVYLASNSHMCFREKKKHCIVNQWVMTLRWIRLYSTNSKSGADLLTSKCIAKKKNSFIVVPSHKITVQKYPALL
jgi:hypothetical protein